MATPWPTPGVTPSPWGQQLIDGVESRDADVATLAAGALNAHTTDATAAHPASAVSVTPSGLITSTNVQAALAELAAQSATKVDKPVGATNGDTMRFNGTVWVKSTTKFFEGTGSPEGVVTAPVGSEFRNTEAGGYSGAKVWRKNTGTGTTGWVVADGDTGWRDVTASIPAAEWNGAGTVGLAGFIRRVGEAVMIQASGTRTNSNGLHTFYALPIGFRASPTIYLPVILAPVELQRAIVSTAFSPILPQGKHLASYGEWMTPNPWPTALPGSAV